jgi:diguanylate cyclase (GGDEF)-like protein
MKQPLLNSSLVPIMQGNTLAGQGVSILLLLSTKAGCSMQMKDILARKNVASFIKPLLQYIVIAIEWWFHFTSPEKPLANAPLVQKEAARRGKLTSMVLCIILSIAVCYIPFIIAMGNIILIIVYTCIVLFTALAALLNRRGKTTLAGLVVIANIEITLTTILLVYPNGLNVSTLPLLSFLIIPTLLAVSTLPAWSVFPVALTNIGIIYASIFFLPKSPDLQTLLSSSPQTIFGIPTMLQYIVSTISFLWVRGAIQGIKEADRADELDHLYQELAHVAETDAITGLPNHRMIMKHVLENVAECEQTQQTCAIMFVDLDHFKRINDTWGHLVGDAVLHEVGQRLQRAVSPDGIVGRYGGEEFAIVLKGSDLNYTYQIAEQARVAISTTECLWQAEDREVALIVTASIGIAIYGLHGKLPETLLEQADQAMYYAKQHGRNRVYIADVSSEEEQESAAPLVTQWEAPAETAAGQALTAAAQAHDAATGAHASRLVSGRDHR